MKAKLSHLQMDMQRNVIALLSTALAVPGWLVAAAQAPETPVPSEHSRHRLCTC